jgi:hypothetical protein
MIAGGGRIARAFTTESKGVMRNPFTKPGKS